MQFQHVHVLSGARQAALRAPCAATNSKQNPLQQAAGEVDGLHVRTRVQQLRAVGVRAADDVAWPRNVRLTVAPDHAPNDDLRCTNLPRITSSVTIVANEKLPLPPPSGLSD